MKNLRIRPRIMPHPLWVLAALSILFLSSLSTTALAVEPVEPTYATATVDGDSSEWESSDFIAFMRKGGQAGRPILAKLYMRYDCDTQIMYAFISSLQRNGEKLPIIVEDGEEVWIKVGGIGGTKVVTSNHEDAPNPPPDFDWVGKGFSSNQEYEFAKGWEASFELQNGSSYEIEVHCNVYEDDESQSAATVNLIVDLNCQPIEVGLVSFTANHMDKDVKLEWSVASEINHAGYNIYRATAIDGDYVKINDALIAVGPQSSSLEEKYYEYLDTDVEQSTLFYKLQDVNLDGQSDWHGPIQTSVASDIESPIELPRHFELAQNYPNPFNPSTTIEYSLPLRSHMTLDIYSVQGTLIKRLVNSEQAAGIYTVTWDGLRDTGEPAPSGIYIYQMRAGDFAKTGRMTLLK